MAQTNNTLNIEEALLSQDHPAVSTWNRLEGRPRTENYKNALKAEVHDALWMLARQWQMGEFRGHDCGSPVFSKIHIATTRLNKYKIPDQDPQLYEENVPLEAKVEQRGFPFKIGEQKMALDIRLLMGRQWIKMVNRVDATFAQIFIEKYLVKCPEIVDKSNAGIFAHSDVWQQFAAVAGRAMDGAELYFYLKADTNNKAYDDIADFPDDKKDDIDDRADKFIEWFESLYYQPSEPDKTAWKPSCLEYQFACSAPEKNGEKILVADEYYHGHLDWYNFSVDKKLTSLDESMTIDSPDRQKVFIHSLIPSPVSFEGMPDTRWWAFEDRKTNFGDIRPDTTDLAHLLLIEFGLVYANDWFIFPYTLSAGSIARINGIAVTNVFGERFWIEPSGKGADEDWQRWNMYTLNIKGDDELPADTSLLYLPTASKIHESKPLEKVIFIRDEMANKVWGIEQIIPLSTGNSKRGRDAALETYDFYKGILEKQIAEDAAPTESIEYKADTRYQLMTQVPENWIPFIPARCEGNNREIQLRRTSMPRHMEGPITQSDNRIRPRTFLLREGLDNRQGPYFIHEEEVPRAGVQVTQSFQRTRCYNGKVVTWLGIRKQIGRDGGEGRSGLTFDQIVKIDKSK